MLTCICMKIVINYHVIQELWVFSPTGNGGMASHSDYNEDPV